jgi:hypothetical protein
MDSREQDLKFPISDDIEKVVMSGATFQILWLLLQDENLKPKHNNEGKTNQNEQRFGLPIRRDD